MINDNIHSRRIFCTTNRVEIISLKRPCGIRHNVVTEKRKEKMEIHTALCAGKVFIGNTFKNIIYSCGSIFKIVWRPDICVDIVSNWRLLSSSTEQIVLASTNKVKPCTVYVHESVAEKRMKPTPRSQTNVEQVIYCSVGVGNAVDLLRVHRVMCMSCVWRRGANVVRQQIKVKYSTVYYYYYYCTYDIPYIYIYIDNGNNTKKIRVRGPRRRHLKNTVHRLFGSK